MATRPVRTVAPPVAKKGDPIRADEWNRLQSRVAALEELVSSLLTAKPGSLGNIHVRTPEGGIPGASDANTPGSASCEVRIFNGTVLVNAGFSVTVYNRGDDIDGGIDIQAVPHQNKQGFLFAAVVYCEP